MRAVAAATRARAATNRHSNTRTDNAVEHVHVGRYCFPLYSHPVFRAKLDEDKYVQNKIEAELRNPALQRAVEALVEELLAQGTGSRVPDAELQQLLQSKLASLDAFYHTNEAHDEHHTLASQQEHQQQQPYASAIAVAQPTALDAAACMSRGRLRTSGIESYSPLTIISRDSVTCTLHTTTNMGNNTNNNEEGQQPPPQLSALLDDSASPSQPASTLPSPAAAHPHMNDTNDATAEEQPLHERRFAPAPQLPPARSLTQHHSGVHSRACESPTTSAAAAGNTAAATNSTPTRHSRIVSDLQPAVIAAHDFLPQHTQQTGNKAHEEEDSSHRSSYNNSTITATSDAMWGRGQYRYNHMSSRAHHIHQQAGAVPLRQWRGAVHAAVYSMLQQRLTRSPPNANRTAAGNGDNNDVAAGGHVLLSEMHRASNTLLAQCAVDTEMLQSRLSERAFAALDIAMDGNSSCVHRRRRAPVAATTRHAGLLPLQVSAQQRAARQRLMREQQLLHGTDTQGTALRMTGHDSVQSKARRIAAALRDKKIRTMYEQQPQPQQQYMPSVVESASHTQTTPAEQQQQHAQYEQVKRNNSSSKNNSIDKSLFTSHTIDGHLDTRRQSEVMELQTVHSGTQAGRTSLSHRSSSLLLQQPPLRPPPSARNAASHLTSSFHDVCAPLLTFQRLRSPEMRTLPGGLPSCHLGEQVQPLLHGTGQAEQTSAAAAAAQGAVGGGEDDVTQQQQQQQTTTSNQARMASRWTTQDAVWNKALQRIRHGPLLVTRMASKKKKGMSMEEKIVKVEQWFGAHPCPYTMKELQALIPRSTGVLYQSIEECVELLVSENRVQEDKVGVHTLFWKLPLTDWQREHGVVAGGQGSNSSGSGAASRKMLSGGSNGGSARERQAAAALALLTACPIDELQGFVDDLQRNLAAVQAAIAERQAALGTAEEMAACTQELSDLRAQRTALEKEVQELALYDPELPAQLQAATDLALAAANRWTENYMKIERHVCEKLGRSARELRAALHVDEGMDYLDEAELAAVADSTSTTTNDDGGGVKKTSGCDDDDEASSHAAELRLVRASSLCRDEASESNNNNKEDEEEGRRQSCTSTEESSPAPRPTDDTEAAAKETSLKRVREEDEEASAGHVKEEEEGEEVSEAAKPAPRARKAKKQPAKTRKRR